MRRSFGWAAPLFVFAAAVALFAPTLTFDFVSWDDFDHIVQNRHVVHPDPTRTDFWFWHAYPITVPTLSWALNHALHGFDPLGFHLVNVLLHALNALLVFRLFTRLRLARLSAAAAALVFALHPVVAEPVSWVTGRKYLLAATFALLALDLWLRERPQIAADLGATVCFALSLLSTPSAAALPLVVFFARGAKRRTLASILPALVILATAVVVLALFTNRIAAVDPTRAAEFPLRVFRTVGLKVALLFPPFDLYPYYILERATWAEPATLLGIASIATGVAVLVLKRLHGSSTRVFVALAAAAIVPVSNILPLTHEIGDSHLYLSLVGVAGLVGVGLARLFALPKVVWLASRSVKVSVSLALPALLAPFVLSQSAIWRDSVSLWRHEHARYPTSAKVCHHYAGAYALAGRASDALTILERCAANPSVRDELLPSLVLAARQADAREKLRAYVTELARTRPEHPAVRAFLKHRPGVSD